MSETPLKAVLLDMDGTLVDAFLPIIEALNLTFAEYNLPPMEADEIRRRTGHGGAAGLTEPFGKAREAATARFLELHDERIDLMQPMPGALELLQWLERAGLKCGVVTSKGEERAIAQFELLDWLNYFGTVIGRVDGRANKPDAEPVRIACERLGVAPELALMVGDGPADMQSAAAAGCMPIGIAATFSAAELLDAGARHCFDSLPEVQAWLQQRIG